METSPGDPAGPGSDTRGTGRPKPRLPDFIIIGAMKSGTTSLYRYLETHPEVAVCEPKEPDFFIEQRNLSKGLDWYRSLFAVKGRIAGEASTSYSKYPMFDGVPARMSRILPDVRLVYVLREPIDRIVSHYSHNLWAGHDDRPMEEAITAEDRHYVYCSSYATQLERYLEHYGFDQIHLTTTRDLRERRLRTVRSILDFIGVEDLDAPLDLSAEHHRSSAKRTRRSHLGWLPRGLTRAFRKVLPGPVASRVRKLVTTPVPDARLEPSLEKWLIELLAPEVSALEERFGLDPQWERFS